jgi:hypothetical protein
MKIIPILELIRLEESEAGTFGILRIQKEIALFTLEPQDRVNAVSISCIPAQQYMCERFVSDRHGETFRVKDVPGRAGIIFHAGNYQDETQGCILLGTGIATGKRGVNNSKLALVAFLEYLKGYNLAHLTVKEVY